MTQSQPPFVQRPEVVVFTGDLVSSSKLSPEEIAEAMRALEAAAAEAFRDAGSDRFARPFRGRSGFTRAFRDAGPARFTRFRGDGWQCLGPEPKFALRAALILRARLSALGRSFDTRISIGIGEGLLDATGGLDGGGGPAFELSGRALDKMPHGQRFAIAWERPPAAAALVRAVFALADEISRNWTPAQARVFAAVLAAAQRPSQEALARDLDITQQAVARHFAGGGDWALREALAALEGEG